MAKSRHRLGSIAVGCAVGLGVFAAGTAATLYFVTDGGGGMLDPYKVAGTWAMLAAIAGRVAYNALNPKTTPDVPG